MAHRRTRSREAAALATALSENSRPDTTTSEVAPGPVPEQIPPLGTNPNQALTPAQVQTMFTNQISLLQQVLASFSDSHTRTTEQVLASISASDARTTALENKFTNLEYSTTGLAQSSAVTDIAQDLQNLRMVTADATKVTSIEQDIQDLRQALPQRKKLNVPSITDVTTIPIPTKPSYELASKTVKLKDLANSLNNIKFTSDAINHIKQNYAMIRQAVDIGCGTCYLLLDIENLTKVPDFFQKLVPPQTHTFYLSILGSYKTISNSLLTFFLRPETVTSSAPQVSKAINSIKSSTDGFVYLAKFCINFCLNLVALPLTYSRN